MAIPVEIELWEENGFSPLEKFIEELPAKDQAWIMRRMEFLSRLDHSGLMRSKYFERLRGEKEMLYEMKFAGSGSLNYRMICFIWQQKVVGLVMFKGSGSGGRATKFSATALHRMARWEARHPDSK
jgi:hypothetical protein